MLSFSGLAQGGMLQPYERRSLDSAWLSWKGNCPAASCLNIGCIPSKSLIHQARLFEEGRGFLARVGAKLDMAGFDYSTVWQTSRLAADRLSKGVRFLLRKNKVELVKGVGVLSDLNSVAVDADGAGEVLRGKAVILATGSRPRSLPGIRIDDETILSSTGLLMSETLPSSMAILGAGAIGMEFAYVLRAFGVDVTVVELLDQILPLEDAESAKIVEKAFLSRGVKILTSAKVGIVATKAGQAELSVVLEDGSPTTIRADKALISVGRAPNTENIGLERAQPPDGARLCRNRRFLRDVGRWRLRDRRYHGSAPTRPCGIKVGGNSGGTYSSYLNQVAPNPRKSG